MLLFCPDFSRTPCAQHGWGLFDGITHAVRCVCLQRQVVGISRGFTRLIDPDWDTALLGYILRAGRPRETDQPQFFTSESHSLSHTRECSFFPLPTYCCNVIRQVAPRARWNVCDKCTMYVLRLAQTEIVPAKRVCPCIISLMTADVRATDRSSTITIQSK